MVLALWAMHDTGARISFRWLLAYASNVQHVVLAHHHNWPRTSIAHVWSLAVEAQFYLVWPWVVLFIPRRRLLPVVVVFVFSGPAFRLLTAWLAGAARYRQPRVSGAVLDFAAH